MRVAVRHRGAIKALSPDLLDDLDRICKVVSQTFTAEHTAEGHHTNPFSIPVALQSTLDGLQTQIDGIQQTVWTTVRKMADEQRANITVTDSELQFAMAANKTYTIRATIYFMLNLASTGNVLKHRWTGPSGATVLQGEERVAGGSYTERHLIAYDSSDQNASAWSSSAAGDMGAVFLDLLVQNGITPGTFALQWGSGKSTAASATVRKGSFLEYTAQ